MANDMVLVLAPQAMLFQELKQVNINVLHIRIR